MQNLTENKEDTVLGGTETLWKENHCRSFDINRLVTWLDFQTVSQTTSTNLACFNVLYEKKSEKGRILS